MEKTTKMLRTCGRRQVKGVRKKMGEEHEEEGGRVASLKCPKSIGPCLVLEVPKTVKACSRVCQTRMQLLWQRFTKVTFVEY
jgi:hypothetical protein